MKRYIVWSCLFVCSLVIGKNARAHGISGKIIQTPGILMEAGYDDGEAVSYTAVEVFYGEETLPFQTGRTDRNGRFLFSPDKSGVWRVIVMDDTGHRISLKTTVDRKLGIAETGQNRNVKTSPTFQKVIMGLVMIFGLSGCFFWIKGRSFREK